MREGIRFFKPKVKLKFGRKSNARSLDQQPINSKTALGSNENLYM